MTGYLIRAEKLREFLDKNEQTKKKSNRKHTGTKCPTKKRIKLPIYDRTESIKIGHITQTQCGNVLTIVLGATPKARNAKNVD